MTIAQMRAFLAALETGSFTAAAQELGMTQASVSELVSRLEREVAASLFTRGGRRLIATAAATALEEHARQAVRSVGHGLDAVHALTSLEGGTTTFGVLRNAAYYDLSDLVERFHARHPEVRVRLVGINSALVADSISRGEIEAGLLVLPIASGGLHVRPLFRDEVLYTTTTEHPDGWTPTIADVAAAKLVLYDAYAGWRDPTRRQVLERARLEGLTIDPAIEVEHVETALTLVAAGAADTIVSASIARSSSFPAGVNTYRFDVPMYDTIALVKQAGAVLSPATNKIARLAEESLLRDRQRIDSSDDVPVA